MTATNSASQEAAGRLRPLLADSASSPTAPTADIGQARSRVESQVSGAISCSRYRPGAGARDRPHCGGAIGAHGISQRGAAISVVGVHPSLRRRGQRRCGGTRWGRRMQRRRDHVGPRGQQHAQRDRSRQLTSPQRNLQDDVVDQMRRRLRHTAHATCAAGPRCVQSKACPWELGSPGNAASQEACAPGCRTPGRSRSQS